MIFVPAIHVKWKELASLSTPPILSANAETNFKTQNVHQVMNNNKTCRSLKIFKKNNFHK